MNKNVLEEIDRIKTLIGGKFEVINEGAFIRDQIMKLKFYAKNAISHLNDLQSLRLKTTAQGLSDLNKIVDDMGDLIDDETRLTMKTTIKGTGTFKEICEKLSKQIDDAVIAIEKLEGSLQVLINQWNKLSTQMSSAIKSLTDDILGSIDAEIKNDLVKLKSADINIRQRFLQKFPTLESWMKEYDDLVKALLEGEEGMFKAADDAPEAVKKEAKLAEENVRRYVNQMLEESGAREIYEGIEDAKLVTNLDGDTLPAGIDLQYKNVLKKFRDRGLAGLSQDEKDLLDLVENFKKSNSSQYDDQVKNIGSKIDELETKKPEGYTDVVMPSPLKMMFKQITDPIYWAFVPYLRRWITSIKYMLFDMSSSYDEFGELFFKKFNEALSRGQGTVKNTKADIARIVYKFQEAPEQFRSVFNNMLKKGGTDQIYEQIWNKFKKEGLEYFEDAKNRYQTIEINGKPTEIDMYKEFEKYISEIENFQSQHPILRNQKFPGLKFLFSECGLKDVEAVVKKDMDGSTSKVTLDTSSEKIEQSFKAVISTIKRLLLSNQVTQGIYNIVKSGFFGSPGKVDEFLRTRYSRDYLKLKRRWGSPTQRGTGAYLFFTSCARKFLLLPLIGATITWIYDFIFGSIFDIKREDNPEKNYILKEETGGAFEAEVICNYVLYHVMTSVENPFRGSLKTMLDGISFEKASREDRGFFGEAEGNTWGYYLQDLISLIPGSGEDVIFWVYNNGQYLQKGSETPEEKAERVYAEQSQQAFDEGLETHDKKLEAQGDSLRNTYGDDPNSRSSEQNKNGWDEYWGNSDETYNIGSLLEPEFYKDNGVPGVLKSMIKFGSLSKKTYDAIKDNRKLKWGLNPGFIGYYQNSAINVNKSNFMAQLKKLMSNEKGKIFNETEAYNLARGASQKIINLFQNPELSKESPFVYVLKDGKYFILRHDLQKAYGDPNKVEFYFPDYSTIYEALKNPKILVVRDSYTLTAEDKQNGITEDNLLRISVNPIKDFTTKTSEKIKTLKTENVMLSKIKRIIKEEAENENFKMKDWDEIFTFQKIDPKTPGQFKDVEIKMRDVMDRIDHWRKRYKKECEENDEKGDKGCDDGEDDSFVRAVIDTHPDVVRVLFTKGLAKLTTSDEKQKLEEGFAMLLRLIREERNAEVEVWSVYRHKSSPDKIWSLVKGDFKQSEMESMGVGMQQPPKNSVEKQEDTLTSLKKKEHKAIESLKINEKNGFDDLPRKLREKLNDKFEDGWTTEVPKKNLSNFYEKKTLSSAFNGDIEIYKVKSPEKFFSNLESNSSDITISRGFCKTMVHAKKGQSLSSNQKRVFDHFVNKCNDKFEGNYSGLRYLSKK